MFLPNGNCIIYNGKADNQQTNLIHTRGEILQSVDMNQV